VVAGSSRPSGITRLRVACALLVGCALLLGCAHAPLERFQSAESLLGGLRDKTSCSRAVSGEAKLYFRGDGRRLSGSVLYLARAPDQLRFDLISPFGVTLTTLTSDGSHFSMFDLGARRFYYGPARTCNVTKFTRVPVPPLALVETLRGRPATIVHESARLSYRTPFLGAPHYQVELVGAHETRQIVRIGVHPDDFALPLTAQRLRYLGSEVWQADEMSYSVALSQFERAALRPSGPSEDPLEQPLPPSGPACEAELPRRIKFVVPGTGYEVTFDHKEQWHNPPLPEAAFRLDVPSGVESIFSNCQ
jgi:outer membrane biogenesis lipoprotein LolB